MKKVIGGLIILFVIVSIRLSYVEGVYDVCGTNPTEECCCANPSSNICSSLSYSCSPDPDSGTPEGGDGGCDCSMGPFTEECTLVCNGGNAGGCDPNRVYTITDGLTGCCPSPLVNGSCNTVEYGDIGMKMDTECLLNGQCSLNVYKVLGIRKSNPNPTVGGLFQDVVLAATTFVGTVIVIALIVSGLIFAFGSISGKDTKRAKTIMIDCFIGLLMVMGSYTIIRLIQFLATAGS